MNWEVQMLLLPLPVKPRMCNSQSDWSLWFWHFACVMFSRVRSTTTCAGRVSIWSWCGSTRSWCWWVSCCRPVTATCCTAPPHIWAAGSVWSTAPTATPRSTCECSAQILQVFITTVYKWNISRDVSGVLLLCSAGLTAPSGRREFWFDTAAASIRPSGRITWPCPLTSRTPGFMWVSVISHPLTQYDDMNAIVN